MQSNGLKIEYVHNTQKHSIYAGFRLLATMYII